MHEVQCTVKTFFPNFFTATVSGFRFSRAPCLAPWRRPHFPQHPHLPRQFSWRGEFQADEFALPNRLRFHISILETSGSGRNPAAVSQV